MNRRTFLKSGRAVGGLLALSGCTETALEEAKSPPPSLDDRFHEEDFDLPVKRKFGVVADGIERADGVTLGDLDEFEAYLTDEGVAVEKLAEKTVEGESILSLSYVSEATEGATLAETVGVVAGGYAALVRSDSEFEELKAELLEPDGRPFGEYEVFTTWAEEYHEGELSAAELGGEVMHTMKSKSG